MDKEIDNILEGYYQKQYDLITVKQKLLVLFDGNKYVPCGNCSGKENDMYCRKCYNNAWDSGSH